jgi:hypothetical protein
MGTERRYGSDTATAVNDEGDPNMYRAQGVAGNKKGKFVLRFSFLANYIQTMHTFCLNYY